MQVKADFLICKVSVFMITKQIPINLTNSADHHLESQYQGRYFKILLFSIYQTLLRLRANSLKTQRNIASREVYNGIHIFHYRGCSNLLSKCRTFDIPRRWVCWYLYSSNWNIFRIKSSWIHEWEVLGTFSLVLCKLDLLSLKPKTY